MRNWYAVVLTCAFAAVLAGCQGLTEPPPTEEPTKGKTSHTQAGQVLEVRETHGTVTPAAR